MKKILILCLIFSVNVFCQNIPCDFSWTNAPLQAGSQNFVTSVKSQPYQGPCLAFAFNAAIETMYGIENSVTSSNLFNLSNAYLDYKVWNAPFYIPDLNSDFKIPLKSTQFGINRFAPASCPVNNPDQNGCSIKRSDIMDYIEHPNGQRSYRIYAEEPTEEGEGIPLELEWLVEDGGSLGSYAQVGNALQLSSSNFSDVDDIKIRIMNEGPIVLQVSGSQNGVHDATLFRSYTIPPEGLSYHAFTIIGWTGDSRWVVKDSWNGMAGIAETHQNPGILSLMNSASVKLYQVSDISYNGGNASTNPVNLVVDDCNPQIELELSSISIEIDYAFISGRLYHKFWVTSNLTVDNWVWGIAYPNGAYRRNQVNNTNYSSVLMSPTTSGLVTVYVRAYKNGETLTKERVIYLSNGQSGGGGGGFDKEW